MYYTFSKQTERVADVIAHDPRGPRRRRDQGAHRVHRQALGEALREGPDALPAASRSSACSRPRSGRRRARSAIPPEAQEGDYDLVVIGSPTWWFRVSVPIRSYLKSPAARKVLAGKPFAGFSTSRRYWKLQRRRHQAVRRSRWGQVDRRDALRGGGQPGPVDAFVAQLHVRLHVLQQGCCACRRPTFSPASSRRRASSPSAWPTGRSVPSRADRADARAADLELDRRRTMSKERA